MGVGGGGIDIDRDYCWAVAGVGRIWICACFSPAPFYSSVHHRPKGF